MTDIHNYTNLLNEKLSNPYFCLHTIYEPEGDYNSFLGDYYFAAVDLFNPGMTFKIYFKANESGDIEIVDVQRWYMG